MERATVERYETDGHRWVANRRPVRRDDALDFATRVDGGAIRLDVGAGAGRYTGDLGHPVIALDAARSMLTALADVVPEAMCVQGDLEHLPFRGRSLGGGWANMSYHHIPTTRVPLALADLHRTLPPGAPVDLQVVEGDYEGTALPGDDVGERFFGSWRPGALGDVMVGAGFTVEAAVSETEVVRVTAVRARTLADTVGTGMRLLICGLNPSVYSADRGVGFARPGNRFWPAMLAAGLAARPLDPRCALIDFDIGMTDLCKRATVASAELTKDEYREGAARVARLVQWLRPGAVCFVGLEGWRAAIDRTARAGVQDAGFGGRPAYLMPSTSGLNAHTQLPALIAHLEAAAELADRS